MSDVATNLRRLFRNRFEVYLANGNHTVSVELDGSPLTLLELCAILKGDQESFPRHYDRDLSRLCGHEARRWFLKDRRYGEVAHLVAEHATLWMEGRLHGACGWVTVALDQVEDLKERHQGVT
jgi:hypothetical protein